MNDMLNGGPSASVSALLARAAADLNAGNYPPARAALTRAMEQDSSGAAMNAFGCFLQHTGQLAEAATCFRKLLAQAECQGSFELQATACNNLAVIHRLRGERALATVYQQRSWSIASELEPEVSDIGCDLGNFAADAIATGNYIYAECLLMLSLNCVFSTASACDQAADWGNLGIVAALRGNIPEAIIRVTKAWQLHRMAGDVGGMGCDLLHLGELCLISGRCRTASRLFERALAHFKRVQFTDMSEKAARALSEAQRKLELTAFDASRN